MNYFIGIDGGGTKTAFILGNREGSCLKRIVKTGCSYLEIGIDNVVSLLQDGTIELLGEIERSACYGCCIGLPCYGENASLDTEVVMKIKKALHPIPVLIVNDVQVGWAGSLACQEGIHLVAGTGSIAIGKGIEDRFVRSGGWNEFFSDEGSCYWVGRKAMELFSKQADGRLDKQALYYLIKERFQFENDFDFIEIMLKEMIPYRDKVASMQKIALEAAKQGDRSVIKLYQEAAIELAIIVSAVKKQLMWSKEPVDVSISGGLLYAKEYVLEPLRNELQKDNCILNMPKKSADEGALLLAINEFNK